MNKVDGEPLIEVSDEAKALHKTLTIVDLHSDTLLWNRNLLSRGTCGHMDLPRLEEVHIVQVAVEVLVLGGARRHVDPLLGRLDVAHVVRLHRAGVVPAV